MHKSTGSHDWPSRTFQPLRTAAKYLLSLRVKSGHPNDAQRPAIRVSLAGHMSCRATSKQHLQQRIESFIAHFNATMAKPFRWTKGKPLVA
jgi:hypothetical protein